MGGHKGAVEFAHVLYSGIVCKGLQIEAEADLDVPLRQVLAVDKDFADLVGGLRVLALFGVVVSKQELPLEVLDDGL